MSFECKFCSKTFAKEKTLAVHLCEQKRRWINRDEKYARMAHMAYNRFYSLTQNNAKEKSYEEFSKSAYYLGFTKFTKYILNINAIEPEKFIDFVIKGSVPLDKWCSDSVYETYIRELNKKETAERALERGILLMEQWGREHDRPYNVFFREISRPRLIHWIKSGRISPWIIFNCDSGDAAIASMTDHELNMINEYLEPTFWTTKFRKQPEDVDFVKKVLAQAGL